MLFIKKWMNVFYQLWCDFLLIAKSRRSKIELVKYYNDTSYTDQFKVNNHWLCHYRGGVSKKFGIRGGGVEIRLFSFSF